eukprot:s1928_g3.t1
MAVLAHRQNIFERTGKICRQQDLPRGEDGDQLNADELEDDEEGEILYFGGVSQERKEPEETEAMQIASRINEALALRRVPQSKPVGPVDTAWYDELGVLPNATTEEIRLKYLEIAETVEEDLAYLLGQGEGGSYQAQLEARDDEEDDEYSWTRWEDEGEDAITLQPKSDIMEAPEEGGPEEEAEILAQEFYRVSNLYQILSVPSLRKIYDEGGVEGLAMRVPALSKGLLEPERVLKMAQGIKTPTKQRESLLLRREPRIQTFRRYQGKNSIRQVLRRITDCIRVWCFKSSESLKFRRNTIYEELPEIAVFGRVNSGKSAMLQHLFSATSPRKNGHFSISQRPGKTKGIQVYCMNRRFTVADMPGYGQAGLQTEEAAAVHEKWNGQWKNVIEDYLNTTHWLRAAIYVHEISKDVVKEDLETIQMLRKMKIPTLLVFTKDDKVDSETHRHQRVMKLREALSSEFRPSRVLFPEKHHLSCGSQSSQLLCYGGSGHGWSVGRSQDELHHNHRPFHKIEQRPDLGFDPEETFQENYAEACGLLEKVLSVPPMGEKFTAAVSGLHSLANILDRLFQAWADEGEKLGDGTCCEDSDAFLKSFGRPDSADSALRKLLAHAGFQRQVTESSKSVWYFDRQDPEIRLRGLTVRLCLQRFSELQRLRGTHRWAQSNNSAVVPSADASLYELLELYKAPDAEGERPSIRERNLDASFKPLRLAQRQRVCERQGKSQMTKLRSSDVRELLAKMPLPPGFTAAQLYFRSTELPSIFGLTSSTGSGATPMGGKNDEKDKDKAADILAREAVGYWAARQAQDVAWPSASLCGVGAALDYTVNRGFVVALLIGFEGATVEEASTSQKSAMQSLRRRQAAAKEAANKAKPSATFGASVGHGRVMVGRQLHWPMDWPHAHYTTRRGGYGQVFKNMVGTMMLGLVATEQREDAMDALKTELPDIFWDYRDKYIPKPRSFFGRKAAIKKSRTYPDEDVVYTEEELEEEEEIAEKRELRALRAEQKARGESITLEDKVDDVKGPTLTPKERLKRWEDMLEEARR